MHTHGLSLALGTGLMMAAAIISVRRQALQRRLRLACWLAGACAAGSAGQQGQPAGHSGLCGQPQPPLVALLGAPAV